MSVHGSDTLTFKECFKKAGFFEKLALCLSSWFGAGFIPGAPGTYGTLAALPLILLLNHLGNPFRILCTILFIPLAIWSSGLGGKRLEREDPPEVVIDEVAGFLLTLLFLPVTWLTLSVGFFLFRFFDIIKPFPIGRLEQKVRGGTGIVLDDLLAGIFANMCLRPLLYLVQ